MEILCKIEPQWASSIDTMIDTVGRSEEGKYHPSHYAVHNETRQGCFLEAVQELQNLKGIHFKHDFCKADRVAHAALWTKMEQARAAEKNVYFRGRVGYSNANRHALDDIVSCAVK